ncbi:MAG: prolyl oligopeptidase family serine peptidase [Halobacteriaceae archaeon]
MADASTGEVRQVTERQLGWVVGDGAYAWVDDRHLFAIRRHNRECHEPRIVTVPDGDQTRTLSREIADRLPYRYDVSGDGRHVVSGAGLLNEDHSLYRFDLAIDDRETLGEYVVAYVDVSPTGEWLAFTGGPLETAGEGPFACRCRLDGSEFETVTADVGGRIYRTAIDWHPDGDEFVFQEAGEDRIGRHAPGEGTTEWVATLDEGRLVGFADGEHLLVDRGDGRLDALSYPDGDVTESLFRAGERPSAVESATATGDGAAVVATGATPERAPRLLWVPMDGSPRELHVTSYGPVAPTDRTPAEYEYRAADGRTAPVEVYHAGGETDPAPVVAAIYAPARGVPEFPVAGVRGLDFFLRRGYTVALAATPSDGLSEAATDDHVALGAWLRDREWVSGDRIAIAGHSAGAHAVAALLTTREDTPWRAGLVHNGTLDLFAQQERDDDAPVPTWERSLGDPEENREAWVAQSPIEHVDAGFDAPVRIHQGVKDRRPPVEQARRFRTALREAGHVEGDDFEYHELPGQGHVTDVVAQQARDLLMYVDFLDRRL